MDRLREMLETLNRNRVRTGLTSMSVAWGIFMLVVLLGAGQGLQNNVAYMFRDDAVNSLWVYRGQTTRPWRGHRVGRNIGFDNDDLAAVEASLPDVEHLTGRFMLRNGPVIAFGDRVGSFDVRSVHPDHKHIEGTLMTSGRFIDELDLRDRRKVTAIGREVAAFLFRGADPIGQWITVGQVPFRVVGVFEDEGGEGEMKLIYLPITTAQTAFGGADSVHQFMFTIGDAGVDRARALEGEVTALMAARKHFDPTDRQALRIRNNVERYDQIQQLFGLLNAFVWVVGIGTVLAGIVGVSNIMLVSVRERTAEIGLRKAVGATPSSIVTMILVEAVALTAVSGYGGLVLGVAVVEGVGAVLPDNDYLRDPNVDIGAAVAATVMLVAFGALAGFVPAWRAASIQPVDALRDA